MFLLETEPSLVEGVVLIFVISVSLVVSWLSQVDCNICAVNYVINV